MLAQEPQVLHRLRQEVLVQVGNSRRPTLDDFKYMKYMRAVINGAFLYVYYRFCLTTSSRNAATLPHRVRTVPIYKPEIVID